jgi:hypothetical protein
MPSIRRIVDLHMRKVPGLREHCDRCLRTKRWGGSVVLMVVDAAFTSIGLNYLAAVVPKVEEFKEKFVESGKIKNLRDLAEADINELRVRALLDDLAHSAQGKNHEDGEVFGHSFGDLRAQARNPERPLKRF